MTKEQLNCIIVSHQILIKRLIKIRDATPVKKRDFKCLAENIIQEINREFGVNCTDPTRKKPIAMARHFACYLLRKHTNLSWVEISNITGNSNHTTPISSYRTCIDLMETDEEYRTSANNVIKRLEVLKN